MSQDAGAHRALDSDDGAPDSDGGAADIDTGDGGSADSTAEIPGGGPGTTRIADKVVERIAQRAVDRLDRATGSSRHVFGVKVGSLTEDTPARVDATVDGELATVKVSMAVRWPESVRQVTRQAREQITSEVTRWTGLKVAHVDVTVPELLIVNSGGSR